MTDSYVIDGEGVRRDPRWGHYLIVPPDGQKPVGYTRVTTVAKALDNGGGLAEWKATMAATGMIMRPGLRAQWESLLAEHDNPWYDSEESKARCKHLVEECAAVGGANDRREQGTSLHALTALVDTGRTPTRLTPETERDLQAYTDGLVRAGVSIVPEAVELIVVLDEFRVAGKFDRLLKVPDLDDYIHVGDLKTGAKLGYAWPSIAVQMAAYSRADAIYRQGPAPDGSEDERLPMPEVDQHRGVIFWLNAGTGQLEIHLVDLDAGWKAFQASMWARGWRKAKVSTPLDEAVKAALVDRLLIRIAGLTTHQQLELSNQCVEEGIPFQLTTAEIPQLEKLDALITIYQDADAVIDELQIKQGRHRMWRRMV